MRSRKILKSFGSATLVSATLVVSTWAQAASLQQVNDWGAANVPGDVSMYIYVPDDVEPNAPVLALIHYCGGTAPAVFGQAQGGGIVSAADQYGFIMVVPSSGRCWDVVSDQTWPRGGGGDSDAIMQMVEYALTAHGGNRYRVYATGNSSGGMMTELLLGLYPDVFKAGAAFAGMPAFCRGNGESGNGSGYSGACAGGDVTRSPQEWGAIVRAMNPEYEGHRPRVQIFHGDADDIIDINNHTEAIKEWTDVLGLNETSTRTEQVQLGNHQATRETWDNDCGFPVLDALTSLGGDHGPSDAQFVAEYVIPFLGLDQTGPVDPEVETCGDGTTNEGGAGGDTGAGGTGGSASNEPNSGGTAGDAMTAGSGGAGNGGTVAMGGQQTMGGAPMSEPSSGNAGSSGVPSPAATPTPADPPIPPPTAPSGAEPAAPATEPGAAVPPPPPSAPAAPSGSAPGPATAPVSDADRSSCAIAAARSGATPGWLQLLFVLASTALLGRVSRRGSRRRQLH